MFVDGFGGMVFVGVEQRTGDLYRRKKKYNANPTEMLTPRTK